MTLSFCYIGENCAELHAYNMHNDVKMSVAYFNCSIFLMAFICELVISCKHFSYYNYSLAYHIP